MVDDDDETTHQIGNQSLKLKELSPLLFLRHLYLYIDSIYEEEEGEEVIKI